MVFRLRVLRDDIVHGLQGDRAKEHFAALGADFCGDVAKYVKFSVPAVNVLDAALFDATFAEYGHVFIVVVPRLP